MHVTATGGGPDTGSEGPPAPRVQARIVGIWKETPTVQGLRLQVDPGVCNFQSGQWVDFWAPGIKEIGGFSIVSTPAQLQRAGTFDLAVKETQHPVAQWICSKAAANDKVHVRVGGKFTLHPSSFEPGRPSLFVAGGIGVTPLASMLATLVERWELQGGRRREGPCAPRAVLLYSARAPEEFALLRHLLDLQESSAGAIQIRLHCSTYLPPPPGQQQRAGGGPPSSGGSVVGGDGSGIEGTATAAASLGGDEESEAGRPPVILLPGGVRSLVRRRILQEDLQAAVRDLRAADAANAAAAVDGASSSDSDAEGAGGAAGSGGDSSGAVIAYVCGPPALSDSVVAQLEQDVEGVGEVVIERWW